MSDEIFDQIKELEKEEKVKIKREKSKAFQARYNSRINLVKEAKLLSMHGEVSKALPKYLEYIHLLCSHYNIDEKRFRPDHLGKDDKNTAEIMCIALVFWDMAKIYDSNPRLKNRVKECLDQFVRFSIGYKFQYLHSEMLRKYIRSGKANNNDYFSQALDKISVHSKKCYIATYCYDKNHTNLHIFRQYKEVLLRSKAGNDFIYIYYMLSPKLVNFCKKNRIVGAFIKYYLIRPVLNVLAKLIQKHII